MEILIENTIIELFLFGMIFLILGIILYLHPPKKIKTIFSYTAASMKSQELWDYSQKYGAKQKALAGVFMIIISFVAKTIPEPRNYEAGMGFAVTLAASLFIKISTERALDKQCKTNI